MSDITTQQMTALIAAASTHPNRTGFDPASLPGHLDEHGCLDIDTLDIKKLTDGVNAYLRQRLADAEAQVAALGGALEEIRVGPTPLCDYLRRIRYGVEDRCLQEEPYWAAEYGYKNALDFCADIAGRALADPSRTAAKHDNRVIKKFFERVCERAEQNMLKTSKLEGAHFAAMQAEIEALEREEDSDATPGS